MYNIFLTNTIQTFYTSGLGSLPIKDQEMDVSKNCEESYSHFGLSQFNYGDQIRIKSIEPSKNLITGLPFQATYCPNQLDSDGFHVAHSVTAEDISMFRSSSLVNPKYVDYGNFSMLTFEDGNNPKLNCGFVATNAGLIFKDEQEICFPLTHQLILLLVAISPYFPKERKRLAFVHCYGDIETVPIRCRDKKPRQIARMLFRKYSKVNKAKVVHSQAENIKPYTPQACFIKRDEIYRSEALNVNYDKHKGLKIDVDNESLFEIILGVFTIFTAVFSVVSKFQRLFSYFRKMKPQSGLATPLTGTAEEASAFIGNTEQNERQNKSPIKFGGTAKAEESTVDKDVIGSYMDERGREVKVRRENNTLTMSAVQTVKKPLHFGGGI